MNGKDLPAMHSNLFWCLLVVFTARPAQRSRVTFRRNVSLGRLCCERKRAKFEEAKERLC